MSSRPFRSLFCSAAVTAVLLSLALPLAARADQGGPQNLTLDFFILPAAQLAHPGKQLQYHFDYNVQPGSTLQDKVAVVNINRTTPVTVNITVADGVTPSYGGGITFPVTGTSHLFAQSLHLAATTVTVPPYSISYIPLALSIASTTRSGDYVGALYATTTDSVSIQTRSGSLHFNRQQSCRIFLRVLGPLTSGLRVSSAHLTTMAPHTYLTLSMNNPGNVVDYSILAQVAISGQNKHYSFSAPIQDIVGGASTKVDLALSSGLARGHYSVQVKFSYGLRQSNTSTLQMQHSQWTGSLDA